MQKSSLFLCLTLTAALGCGKEPEAPKPEAPKADGEAKPAEAAAPAAAAPKVAVPGVTDTEIVLGTHGVLTGPLAVYATITKTFEAYVGWINDQGGINGRKLRLIVEDDQFNPAKTVEVTKKLVEQDKVFAMVGSVAGGHLAVMDYLAQQGVPDMFIVDLSNKYTTPIVKTRFQANLPSADEAAVFTEYIIKNFPGKRVGFLGQNDSIGQEGLAGAKAAAGDRLKLVEEVFYDPMTQNSSQQVLKLKKAKAEVVLSFTTPGGGLSAVKFGAQNGFKPQWVSTYINQFDASIMLGGPPAMEGFISGHMYRLESEVDHPGMKRHQDIMKKYAPGVPADTASSVVACPAETFFEVLKRAGRDLTRESLVAAAEGLGSWDGGLMCPTPVTLSATDHNVYDKDSLKLVQVKQGKWAPIAQ